MAFRVEGMMIRVLDELTAISRAILAPEGGLPDLIPQAQSLRNLFEELAHFRVDHGRDIGAGETRLDCGLAISPTLAAMCLREPFRTLAFIRGLAEAIDDALRPDRAVRVLYAGCGPYALLAVPLMTVFPREQVMFTLLDIHQECLDSALALIDTLGLTGHVAGGVCADATRYKIPPDGKPDVIVSETMAVCLRNEPQVSIARHLLAQAPEAQMVPRSVSVEVCLLNQDREHVLVPPDHPGEIPTPERDRVYLGKIFELDAAAIRSWRDVDGDRLAAALVKIPDQVESRYRPYCLTRIAVYGKHLLQDYDCSLTVPQPLGGRRSFEGGETLQFHYKLGSCPGLEYGVWGCGGPCTTDVRKTAGSKAC